MSLQLNYALGGDVTIDRDAIRVVVPLVLTDTLPKTVTGDYFDYAASLAMAWVIQNARTFNSPMGLLYWNSIQIHENHYAQNYSISVTYGPHDRQAGAYQISVDQTGGTVHVTAGTVIGKFGADAPADLADVPDTIGVEGDTVRGIDLPLEQTKINVQFRHPAGKLNREYIRLIGQLVGFPNNDGFLGYAAGEVVFMGGNFSETDTEASASYSFAISYNRENFTVAGITITQKYGWDILDPVFQDEDLDGKATRTIKYFKTIRPAGRSWTNYATVFGWGGN